jgi:hypothetical protein
LKKGRAVLSAFLRRHCKEGGGLLLQVFTATLRTPDLVLFVFRKGKEDFKWLLAIFAIEIIARHVDLRKRQRGGTLFHVYAQATPLSRQVKRTSYGGALPNGDHHALPATRDSGESALVQTKASQASDVGSIPIARSRTLDDSIAFMRLSR